MILQAGETGAAMEGSVWNLLNVVRGESQGSQQREVGEHVLMSEVEFIARKIPVIE